MIKHFLIAMASCTILGTAVLAMPAYSDTRTPMIQKPAGANTTLRKKAGYWTECSYSALGDNCYTVYAGIAPAGKSAAAPLMLLPLKASANVKLRKKAGYWTECSYSALGDNCYTVYAGGAPKGSAPGAAVKLRPVAAAGNVKLTKKAGYWMECSYSGLGENCYYVYARPHKAAKPKP